VNIKASPRVTSNGTDLSLTDRRTGFPARRLVGLGTFTLSAVTAEEGIDSIYVSIFHIQYETSSENKSFLILSKVITLSFPPTPVHLCAMSRGHQLQQNTESIKKTLKVST